MKLKVLTTALLLATANFAWVQGGLSADNVDMHAQVSNRIITDNARPEVTPQGPVDQFKNYANNQGDYFADTEKLKQGYNGQS